MKLMGDLKKEKEVREAEVGDLNKNITTEQSERTKAYADLMNRIDVELKTRKEPNLTTQTKAYFKIHT